MIQPYVTIIIPTFNNVNTIQKCLDSLLALDYDNFDIYVVDNESKDGTAEILQKYQEQFGIKVIEARLNAPQAYNLVLGKTQSEIIGLIDGDAIANKDWLKILVPHLEFENVAGAGGIMLTANPENRIPKCIGYELEYRFRRMPKYVSRLPTANLLLKRRLIESFDEKLSTGYDADICYRLVNKGYKIVYDEHAEVYHFHRDGFRNFSKQQYYWSFNDIRLYLKHPAMLFKDTQTPITYFTQPLTILAMILLFFLGVYWETLLMLATFLVFFRFLSNLFFAVRMGLRKKNIGAIPVLFTFFTIRMIVWTYGGIMGIINLIRTSLLRSKI